jgi:hypothetical protein
VGAGQAAVRSQATVGFTRLVLLGRGATTAFLANAVKRSVMLPAGSRESSTSISAMNCEPV